MIVVAGIIRFADQVNRDGAVAATVEHQLATRHDEDGCLAYCFAADPADATAIQVYELWADEASLTAHFEHPNYRAMRAAMRGFERAPGTVTEKFRCDLSAPVYGADGVATARFDS